MLRNLVCAFVLVFLSLPILSAQQEADAPFVALERAVNAEKGGWAGDKRKLSAVFDSERRHLGDRLESELLKWVGKDPERHYWISSFLESESYLHGNERLPQLSLLIKQQGLALVQDKDDRKSRGYVVGLSITAAILSDELGLAALASSYKNQAETLLVRDPDLGVFVPVTSEQERRRYDAIPSAVKSKETAVVVGDPNPPPRAKISGGVLNGKAIKLMKPIYSAEACQAGAAGTVAVQLVIDEGGNVIWAKAISGHPLLQKAAEEAAWQTKFEPIRLSGELVKVTGVLMYNFVR